MKLFQSRPMKCPSRAATLFLIILLALIATADLAAQTTAQTCPNHKPLTLDQIDKFIEQHIQEDRTLQLIQACHVDFSMDPPAIQHLASSGATEQILDALNNITSGSLTLDQAKAEIPQLERLAKERDKPVEALHGLTLLQLKEAFEAQRAKAAQITPQGQFEPDRDYAQRVAQSQATIASLETQYQLDRSRVEEKFNKRAILHAKPFLSRIEFLKKLSYPDQRPVVFSNYDPNSGLLKTALAGDIYQFEQVPPKSAETLYNNWKQVILLRPFEETQKLERTITLGTISITGYSVKAREAILDRQKQYQVAVETYNDLKDARSFLGSQNVTEALGKYQAALKLDPANQEATQEIAAIQALLKSQSDLVAQQKNEGVWADNKQHMWPLHDNGADVNWKSAGEYCRNLRTGGFSDWRLPSHGEFEAIYNRNSTRMTSPHAHTRIDLLVNETGQIAHKDKVPAKPYHVDGDIQLTEVSLWVSDPTPPQSETNALVDFSQGRIFGALSSRKEDYRVLCVRSYKPSAGIASLSVPTTPLVPPAKPDETTP